MAPHPLRRQIRHRHLRLNAHPRTQRPLPGFWTWSRAAPRGSSKPGWPPAPISGVSVSRSSRWMDSLVLRALPPKNSPMQGQSWIPSMLYTWLATLWMSAAGVSSKNFTIGAGVPRIPCTRLAGCYTPDLACSRRVSSTNYSTCFPVRSTSHSRSLGVPTRTSLMPTARLTHAWVRP